MMKLATLLLWIPFYTGVALVVLAEHIRDALGDKKGGGRDEQ